MHINENKIDHINTFYCYNKYGSIDSRLNNTKETDFNINCCATQDTHTRFLYMNLNAFSPAESSCLRPRPSVRLTPADSLLLVFSVSAPHISKVLSLLRLHSQNFGHQTFDEMRAHGRANTHTHTRTQKNPKCA